MPFANSRYKFLSYFCIKMKATRAVLFEQVFAKRFICCFYLILATQFNSCHSGYLCRGTLANSEDPDEMPHNAAFDMGLHCSLR